MWPTFRKQTSQLLETITLDEGDLLYVPAGFPHRARAEDQASLHLTAGLRYISYHEIVRAMYERALLELESELEARLAVGSSRSKRGPQRAITTSLIRKVAAAAVRANAQEIFEERQLEARSPHPRDARRAWKSRMMKEAVTATTIIAKARCGFVLRGDRDSLEIVCERKKLVLPVELRDALGVIRAQPRVAISALDTGPYDATELAKILIEHGIVDVAG
jgi:bifunctional lysine-specific demethylase and histidyl-hydroxylase NO66